MKTQFVGFNTVKQSVSISQVLERYGLLERLHRSGNNLYGPCPIHQGHNPDQFHVNLSKNCWMCFGDCQRGGSIIDFVSQMEGIGVREAALHLQEWFGLHAVRESKPTPKTELPLSNPALRSALTLDPTHPYLRKRGLREETIATFGVGYCSCGLMAGRVAIPIHNQKGALVAYAGRWPGNPPLAIPQYRMPRGFRKSLEVFNLYRALQTDSSNVLIIVEGFFGCMKVWQAGFRKVVSLMGSRLSETQAELITKTATGKVILLFDEDDAGRKGREQARLLLSAQMEVKVISLPAPQQQPDRLSSEALQQLLA